MSTTYEGTEEPGGDRAAEAQQLLSQLLGMRDEMPDPNDLIDLAAAHQLRAIGRVEAALARRAERDTTITRAIRGDADPRVELRSHRAKSAQRRAEETDLLAMLLEEADRPDAVRKQVDKEMAARRQAAKGRAPKDEKPD